RVPPLFHFHVRVRPLTRATLFPYTTLFRSDEDVPASAARDWPALGFERGLVHEVTERVMTGKYHDVRAYVAGPPPCVDAAIRVRSEEHTSELQSRVDLVCRLLLEKKNGYVV